MAIHDCQVPAVLCFSPLIKDGIKRECKYNTINLKVQKERTRNFKTMTITKGKTENLNRPVSIEDTGKVIKNFIPLSPKRHLSKRVSCPRSRLFLSK